MTSSLRSQYSPSISNLQPVHIADQEIDTRLDVPTMRHLPRLPLNAASVQLVGQKGGEPEGRAANLIQLFGGGVTVKLSSAAVPDEKSDDTILIGPPFYLEVSLMQPELACPFESSAEHAISSLRALLVEGLISQPLI